MRLLHAIWLLAAGLSAAIPARAQTPGPAEHPGPSFACPVPRDPLGQLICNNATLARADLEFVQTYQALRQQSAPSQQQALRVEAVDFSRAVRADCGIGPAVGPAAMLPAPPSPDASDCVEHDYRRQREAWAARLAGPAAQEAGRAIDQQIALQQGLQRLGLLPPSELADGVYGSKTRTAILTFQQTMGLPLTGLLGDADAVALMRQTAPNAPPPAAASPTARSAWEDFRGEAAAAGVTTTFAAAGPCVVVAQIRDPDALGHAALESLGSTGGPSPGKDAAKLFAAELEFLRTYFAARAVQAFYATQPAADVCRFETVAFTTDVYGRDVAQPLFSFQFDRATYGKVVWTRFDPANMPKIILSFDYGAYAKQRLRDAGYVAADTPVSIAAPRPPEPPATLPVSDPAPTPPTATRAAMPTQQAMAPRPPNPVVARWSGSATLTTRPFHVDGAWELRWASNGWFNATLHQVGADGEQVLAMATKRAASSAFQPEGGDFYIEFSATDDWAASINPVPPPG